MKKLIVLILVFGLIGSLWINLRNSGGLEIGLLSGETQTLRRGSFTIPITANGTIEPKQRIEIKSEASGTVEELPYEVGAVVNAGSLLVRLDPQDEQRLVDMATKALKTADINLNRAQSILIQRQESDLNTAKARLEQIQADLNYAEFEFNRTMELAEKGVAHEDEDKRVNARYLALMAQKKAAEADVERAKINIELARQDLEQAKLNVSRAKDDLADAQERLRETKITAPIDGMLTRLVIQEGGVVSSATTTFTGGTTLGILSDVSSYYVRTLVDEADIGRVREIAPITARPGSGGKGELLASNADDMIPIELETPVKITVEAFPTESFEGVIELIEPEPDNTRGEVITRYVTKIRITSENASKLFLGMQANVEFVSETVEDAILVPNEAVRFVGGRRGVYLQVDSTEVHGKKTPKFRPFRSGLDNGEFTQVLEGLDVGDVVYTKLPRDSDFKEIKGEG